MVRSQRIWIPSSIASFTSKACAGITARVRRYTTHASSAPRRFTVRAASSAVLPPPYTSTRRPMRGGSPPSSTARRSASASTTRDASHAGISTRFARCAPTAAKHASKPPSLFARAASSTRASSLDAHAELDDAGDLRVEDLTRQAVARNPVAHHPAELRRGVADGHVVPETREVIRGREPARPASDDEHALLRRGARRLGEAPPFADREVAEEALDGVDRHRLDRASRGCTPSRTGGSRRAP